MGFFLFVSAISLNYYFTNEFIDVRLIFMIGCIGSTSRLGNMLKVHRHYLLSDQMNIK